MKRFTVTILPTLHFCLAVGFLAGAFHLSVLFAQALALFADMRVAPSPVFTDQTRIDDEVRSCVGGFEFKLIFLAGTICINLINVRGFALPSTALGRTIYILGWLANLGCLWMLVDFHRRWA